jgi:hypothetical protein
LTFRASFGYPTALVGYQLRGPAAPGTDIENVSFPLPIQICGITGQLLLDAPIDFNFRITEGAFVNSKWEVREDRIGRRKVRPSYGGGMGKREGRGRRVQLSGRCCSRGYGVWYERWLITLATNHVSSWRRVLYGKYNCMHCGE